MIRAHVAKVSVALETHPGLFSPRALDAGTLAMLARVQFSAEDKVLDLGCGYGVVGIVVAKLIIRGSEISPLWEEKLSHVRRRRRSHH